MSFKKLLTIASVSLSCIGVIHAQESSVIRLNATLQGYNPGQPWDKAEPKNRRGLVTYLGKDKIITSSELVANAAYLEFETVDGSRRFPAEVVMVDYEANLALLKASSPEGADFLADQLEPVSLANGSKVGDSVSVLQFESNGMALQTEGKIRGAKIMSGLVPGNFFLHYMIKASMESAASSFSIPVFKDGKLLSVVTSYNSEEQILEGIAPEILNAFLADAEDGDYKGFPRLGLATTNTSDRNFREWLKLDESHGGLYVSAVKRNSSAEKAGMKKGDVVLSFDGKSIDRQGFYQTGKYGKLHWGHLVRAENKSGETVKMKVLRNGEIKSMDVTLEPTKEGIIPSHTYDKAPNYLVKGGLIFQELNGSFLRLFGESWRTRAPLGLLDVYNHPEDYEEGINRVVFISAVIPTPASLGYEQLRSLVITKVNDKKIADINTLVEAFEHPTDGIHKIEFLEDPKVIYLSAKISEEVGKSLLQRGLPSLSRTE